MQYTGIQILIILTSPSNRWSMEVTLYCIEEINFLGIRMFKFSEPQALSLKDWLDIQVSILF
jgi:hypothetical protein